MRQNLEESLAKGWFHGKAVANADIIEAASKNNIPSVQLI